MRKSRLPGSNSRPNVSEGYEVPLSGAWSNSKIWGGGGDPLVYCTISLIAMQGYRTNTEYTGSLGYNSVCYIISRIGCVSLKGI